MELKLSAIDISGKIETIFEGMFSEIQTHFFNPELFTSLVGYLKGNKLQIAVNEATSKSKIADLTSTFTKVKMLFGYEAIEIVFDNTLSQSGTTRDSLAKWSGKFPTLQPPTLELIASKEEALRKKAIELNQFLAEHNLKEVSFQVYIKGMEPRSKN